MSDDLESGDTRFDISVFPAYGQNGPSPSNIQVTRNFEQHFEDVERKSETDSQKNLVR